MVKNPTTWKKYPMKTSEIIDGLWKVMWNRRTNQYDKIQLILYCIKQHSPHIGWGGNPYSESIIVDHTGKGTIAKGKSMRHIIRALEKSGILIDDLHLTNKFRFVEDKLK